MQGVGAAGAATVLGTTAVGAQENTTEDGSGAEQGSGAAIRAAHASPDAPNVDVRVDGNAVVEGLGFGEVSSYNVVEPGTHQVELVATGGGLDDFLSDLFGDGGGSQDETVLFDTEIDVEEGATQTLVAYGEVAQGPVPADGGMGNETDGGMADGGLGNETDGGIGDDSDGGLGDGGVGNESDGGLGDDTDGGLGDDTDGGMGNETDGGLGDGETDGGLGDGATGSDQQLVEGLSYGQTETFEVDAGDYTLQISESTAAGMDGGVGDGETDGGLGDGETDGGIGDGETDGGIGDGGVGNESDGGLGDGDMGNETDGSVSDGGLGEDTDTGAGGTDGSSSMGGMSQGFQVDVLEDEITDPGEDTAQVRVFHAVPDVNEVSISVLEAPDAGSENGTDGGMGNESDGGLGGTENETDGGLGDGDMGNESDGGLGDGGLGNDSDGGLGDGDMGDGGAQDAAREVNVSFTGGTVNSGFAIGYFDPQAAADGGAGNETDGGMGNDSDGGLGGDQGNGTATGDDVAQDASDAEFQFVVVQDAEGGERADGGTGSGILGLGLVEA